ncbi:hypothetical protein FB451DRAFT_1194037 [Mycena latifolia]|nr:hypothetical protein FB451DRAFT_1194037 [Mycena latifolia]
MDTSVLRLHAPPSTRLLCTPPYYPDAGHEDKLAHSKDPDGWFYAVVRGHVVGVVSSEKSLERLLAHNETQGAPFLKASTWLRILDLWNDECTQYHQHEHDEGQLAGPPAPSPASATHTSLSPTLSSPSSLAPSPPASAPPSRSPPPPSSPAAPENEEYGMPFSREAFAAIQEGTSILSPEQHAAIVAAHHAAREAELLEYRRECEQLREQSSRKHALDEGIEGDLEGRRRVQEGANRAREQSEARAAVRAMAPGNDSSEVRRGRRHKNGARRHPRSARGFSPIKTHGPPPSKGLTQAALAAALQPPFIAVTPIPNCHAPAALVAVLQPPFLAATPIPSFHAMAHRRTCQLHTAEVISEGEDDGPPALELVVSAVRLSPVIISDDEDAPAAAVTTARLSPILISDDEEDVLGTSAEPQAPGIVWAIGRRVFCNRQEAREELIRNPEEKVFAVCEDEVAEYIQREVVQRRELLRTED